MQEIQSLSPFIIQHTQSKIEESLLEVRYQIDSSFVRIDELIDSFLLIPLKNMNHLTELQLKLPQTVQFSISEFNVQSQILETVTPIINQIIQNKIEIQEPNLMQKNEEEKMINEEEGSNKDSQQIQIKESDRILFEENQKVIVQPKKQVIQYKNEQQLMMDQQVEFKLIDDSIKQSSQCYAIVFDNTGSIMISGCIGQIKIWNFEKGKLDLSNSYDVHQKAITCLVYSQKKNSFISGSSDKTIICWQQMNQKEWKFSQPYQQHDGTVNCLMLNQQEDQIISGGQDKKIIVWLVDFIKNELVFLYSLDKHTNCVGSLSFNQSETLLASNGYGEFIIWEKGQQGKCIFNDLLVFELQNGDSSYNSNKIITFIRNHECQDRSYFPIIHNKDRHVILIRHKYHFYLIREFNDGTFKIVSTLNCQSNEIFGTMTNNGQYLVFHDFKSGKYSSYEILQQ